MKKILLIVAFFAMTLALMAQSPKLNYQAVVRNSANELVNNENLTVDITIANSLGGASVYGERHAVTSNANGLVSLIIGNGTNQTGNMNDIEWATAFITSDYTLPGGTHVINTVPVSAVPYALYADKVNEQSLSDYLTSHDYATTNDVTAQVNADWEATSGAAQILNKPTLFSGDYNDLTNKPVSNFFVISYNANTGSGYMNVQVFPEGIAQSIMYNTFTKTGYNFAGWNEKADNSGTNHIEGESITLTENKTLYAQWSLQHYTISYNNNGAEGSMESQAFVYGTPQNLTANTFTKVGHIFNGWNTQADGNGIAYTDQYNLSATSDLVLYAQWVPETYTLTFMANNGTDEQATQTFTYGQAQNLMSNPFTYTGYNFADWNTAADGNGDGYSDHKNMTLTADMTLYARWTLIPTFVVTFNANGGTGTMANQTFMQGVAQALAHNTFTREGFDFMGWNTNASGMGTYYSDGQSVTLNTTTTLYAKWQKNSSYEEPETVCTVTNIRGNETGTGNTISAVRDHQNNTYTVVQIGSQCWLKENMRATTSPSTKTDILQFPAENTSYTGKRAYYPRNNADTAAKYGVLYNWNAAVDTFNTAYGEISYGKYSENAVSVNFVGNRRGICPEGWHIPSTTEWNTMLMAAGVTSGHGAGKLVGGNDWPIHTPVADDEGDEPGNMAYSERNSSGFSAVPAGYYNGSSYFGSSAHFWSATQDNRSDAYYRYLDYYSANVGRLYFRKYDGYSVRCVRD